MNREAFEERLLQLWITTRIPLTRPNLQILTGVSRPRVEKWLDALAVAGVVEVEASDAGHLTWRVLGAERPRSGPETVAEKQSMDRLHKEVSAGSEARSALVVARQLGALSRGREGDKSILASGLLSFFFGPAGWLYAAPLRSAAPVALVYVILCLMLPKFLLLPLLGLAAPLSALAGVGYAWRYNQTGTRTPLLGPKPPSDS